MQPQVAELQAQGLPGDPQQAGGLVLIPAGVLQDARQQEPVHLAVRLRVQVAGVGPEPLADERLPGRGLSRRRRRRAGSAGSPSEFGQEGREQDGAAGLQQGLLQDALQLADVARPGVAAQPLQRLRGDLADLPPQLAAEAPQVVLHQQRQVVAPLAQAAAGGW